MRHQFKLSEVGLKLIKSYEGFRPTARQLESGRRVAGYSHNVGKGESLSLSKDQAEALLVQDLEPYVALVNDYIYAPMTQGQFDALVSLAFNIGTDAFLSSDVLSAMNNGRILDAANAFDIWRKSEIGEQVFTIDALVRRRTSEKVLFLRPEKAIALAPRLEIPPQEDASLQGLSTFGPEVQSLSSDSGIVESGPGLTSSDSLSPSRRREDGPAGVLTLSEIHDDAPSDEITLSDDLLVLESDAIVQGDNGGTMSSPIATAAAEVSERLDALMEQPRRNASNVGVKNILSEIQSEAKVLPFTGKDRRKRSRDLAPALKPQGETPKTELADNLPPSRLDYLKARKNAQEDDEVTQNHAQTPSERPLYDYDAESENEVDSGDSAKRFIDKNAPVANPRRKGKNPNVGPFTSMFIAGLTLMGGCAGAIASGFDARWGAKGEMATTIGFLIGGLLLLGSVYYLLKILFTRGK